MRGRLGSIPPPGGQWGCVEFKFPDVLLSRLTLCTAHCSAVCLTQLSPVSLAWSGCPCWLWLGRHLFRPGWCQAGRALTHNSHCAAFSACDPGCCGTRPPLAGRHSRRITQQHSTLTGTRDRGPGQIVCQYFKFATFLRLFNNNLLSHGHSF